jgi:uncharacterized RDD family membrane protein YckC
LAGAVPLVACWMAYEVPLTGLAGRTVGKLALGIRVVARESSGGGARPGLARATVRTLGAAWGSLVWFLDRGGGPAKDRLDATRTKYLLHDKRADTITITEASYRRLRDAQPWEQERLLATTHAQLEQRYEDAALAAARIDDAEH